MTYVVNILRRLIPIFYIVSKTGIPMRVLVPVKISNKPLFDGSPYGNVHYGNKYTALEI